MEGIRDLISPDGTLDLVGTVAAGQDLISSTLRGVLSFFHQHLPFLSKSQEIQDLVDQSRIWKPHFVVAPRWNPGELSGRPGKGRDSWPAHNSHDDVDADDVVELGDHH